MGFDAIRTGSSIIEQLDSSRISSGLSSHGFHSNPKHLFGAFLGYNIFEKFHI